MHSMVHYKEIWNYFLVYNSSNTTSFGRYIISSGLPNYSFFMMWEADQQNITSSKISIPEIKILANIFSITQGQSLILNPFNLMSNLPNNNDDSKVSYQISNISHCWFQSSGINVTSFTQLQIAQGIIVLIHDNSLFVPFFNFITS